MLLRHLRRVQLSLFEAPSSSEVATVVGMRTNGSYFKTAQAHKTARAQNLRQLHDESHQFPHT